MCIPHGAIGTVDNGFIEKKEKKHIKMVSKEQFEKGDPNFVDERVEEYTPKRQKFSLDRFIFGEKS